jgi:hypothetical protein
MTAAELDQTVESWMLQRFGTVIDFDINGPIKNLSRIQGRQRDGKTAALLTVDEAGRLHIPPLADALHILDDIWDGAYRFSSRS